MYEDNARKTNAVLNAINPALAIDIIGLGKPGSMLAVKDRLDEGHLVGILADRSLESERRMAFPFLGASGALSGRAVPHGGDARTASRADARPVSRRPPLRHHLRDHLDDARRTNRPRRRCDATSSGLNTTAAAGHTIGSISMISGHERRQATGIGLVAQAHRRRGPVLLLPYRTFADPLTSATPWGLAAAHGQHAWRAQRKCALCGTKIRPVCSIGRCNPSGTLIFNAPDRLQKQTLAPAPSRLTVDGDHLTVVQPDGKTSDLSLSQFPRSAPWSRAFAPRWPATVRR